MVACDGRRPLQQIAPADEQSKQGSNDCVRHQPGLVREQSHDQQGLRERAAKIGKDPGEVHPGADARVTGPGRRKHRRNARKSDRAEEEKRPHQRRFERQRPTRKQGQHAGQRRDRPAQIVDHFPAAARRHACRQTPGFSEKRAPAEDPGQQLPVAARPAMVAQRGDVVARRIGFDDLDVGGEAGAGEHPLEQIVAEQGRVRNPVGENGLEGIDRVDALAGIGTLAEEVLIDVGDGGGIGIDSVGARECALIGRAFVADRKVRSDARLEDRIALDDAPPGGVDNRLVQRMRHLADQPPHRVGRKPRIRVQGDDIMDALRHCRRAPVEAEEGRVAGAAQQAVQLVQLAALALPADPQALAFVPHAAAMEQEEPVAAGRRRVPAVQAGDRFDRGLQERVVALDRLACRIGPVREQGELDLPADACEMMDLQPLDLLDDGFRPGQQCRHHHQGAQMAAALRRAAPGPGPAWLRTGASPPG